ncbi:sigma-54-dependent transcriptional regulator [Solemya velum gill symbiont]|uniref:Sigma-54-dependent Fis family transcriptional regulator n=1 Tax=Solemya velum gill symbiont TaxID=2340 RepID=A0A1T2GC38_SOVGS|nr:sigma-54 dependent transcriptional regulator [Solemya velum gill symbiont]OOY35669.1 sigma-54-dependent Fis family transcriptional regulator [Solemya velum gill symbiont]OOY38297.1 sigma-54-dependent Fis family transcriptional regulator [Solemya velum gill symbiont]OOY40786.1 sigma-54-dependent Fis family transcriptional regulator [Solemya velum gill symbiont]OOY44158.1 sigma-54-dependent Fis family transcriptional regulator [Solemya velum gill symbiont]OOY52119.1 sigma-54-dependent Fis fam
MHSEKESVTEVNQLARLTSLLLVDADPSLLSVLRKSLSPLFDLVEVAENATAAEELLSRIHFDLVISDSHLPDYPGLELVRQLRKQGDATPVIFTSAATEQEAAIEALRLGAADFLVKPFVPEEVVTAARLCLDSAERQGDAISPQQSVEGSCVNGGLIGSSAVVTAVCDVIRRVAPMPSTVLLDGESGTGKELAARAIHDWSGRSGGFVPVNCGAMTGELLESELFGHAKGAFTGATQARDGLFFYANGGTIFLDEIGEMPMTMQTHLLRVMEEREVRPVGGNHSVPVDVRIVAATNRDLKTAVEQGTFRADLYYRLNVLTIRMPTLRERKEDIPELASWFATTISAELGLPQPQIDKVALHRLKQHDWPGNVRELKNVVERCLLLGNCPSECLDGTDFSVASGSGALGENANELLLETVERQHILRVLELESGNKSAAARLLGVSRKTLDRKCRAWEAEEG